MHNLDEKNLPQEQYLPVALSPGTNEHISDRPNFHHTNHVSYLPFVCPAPQLRSIDNSIHATKKAMEVPSISELEKTHLMDQICALTRKRAAVVSNPNCAVHYLRMGEEGERLTLDSETLDSETDSEEHLTPKSTPKTVANNPPKKNTLPPAETTEASSLQEYHVLRHQMQDCRDKLNAITSFMVSQSVSLPLNLMGGGGGGG